MFELGPLAFFMRSKYLFLSIIVAKRPMIDLKL